MFDAILLNTDSYKASHYLQYPPGSEYISSYIEARGGEFNQVLFFGLQAFLKQYLCQPINQQDIDEAEAVLLAHGEPFNRDGWTHILKQHQGHLPIEIQALPEGLIVPVQTALVQIVNTDPAVPWLTSWLETALLRAVWYPSTVATLSWQIKQVIHQALLATSDNPEQQLPFKLHDFGARGVSSQESAGLGGMAHLLNFSGTDTITALLAARRYYDADVPGFSIPAAEHSTITAWGQSGETEAYANMLQQFAQPGQLLAVVSDSYDIYHAVSEIWGRQLKSQVENSGATVIIRPDSGTPEVVVLEVLERLYQRFGGHVNQKGYRVLAPCIRVIQGDGVNQQSIQTILERMQQHGFSADNIAFGMGGALLQKLDRDTLGFAMKTSAIRIQGNWHNVCKSPITDPFKHSKTGRLSVRSVNGQLETVLSDQCEPADNLLQPVYHNGGLILEQSFDTIRQRSS